MASSVHPGPPESAERNTDDVRTVISAKPSLAPADGAWIGRRLAHFEVVESIGTGGMGIVLKAFDLSLGRNVALKVLSPEWATDPERLARFRLEARAAARLDHPNLARVYYCGEEAGVPFIAFEYVDGRDLRQLIAKRKRIPPDEVIEILRQVAGGLAHAAERGVIHRDVKPSNIVVTRDGVAKLVDMGLARIEGPADVLTQSGMTLGTFDYVSPEQALDPRSADARSDLYSLGCTMYHALTGHPPAPDGTAAKKLEFHRTGQPDDPRIAVPDTPDHLVEMLARMMAKNPSDRYASPAELVAELAGEASVVATTSGSRMSRRMALGSAAATLGLVALAEWGRRRHRAEEPISDPATLLTGREPLPAPVAADESSREAANATDLERLLTEDNVSIRLTGTRYDIESAVGLKFRGSRLRLASANPFRPAELRWVTSPGSSSRALLQLLGDRSEVAIRGVRLVVEGGPAVLASGPRQLDIEQCVFHLASGSAALSLARPVASVNLNRTAIVGGFGFELAGASTIHVQHGAFLSMDAIAVCRPGPSGGDSVLRFDQSTLGVVGRSAFQFVDGAGASLQFGHSLVAAGGTPGTSLVWQTGSQLGDVEVRPLSIRGAAPLANAYFGLQPFWVNTVVEQAPVIAATLDDALGMKLAFFDLDSAELAMPPCRAAGATLAPGDDGRSFLAIDARLTDLRIERVGTEWLGATMTPWGRVTASTASFGQRRPKVIDPSRDPSTANGQYRTISQALPDLRGDETILIRSNEPIMVPAMRLDRPELRLTLAAFPGYRPTLVLLSDPGRPESLISVAAGRLTCRDVQFRIGSDRVEPAPFGLLTIGSAASVELDNCVITMDGVAGTRLAVITAVGERSASVRMYRCLIRGAADLLAAQANRRVELAIHDSAIGLNGRIVVAEDQPSIALLAHRSTILSTRGLIEVRPEADSPPNMLQVDLSQACLVAGSPTALVRVQGPTRRDDGNRWVTWKSQQSAAINWATAIEGTAGADDSTSWSIPLDQWRPSEDLANFFTTGHCPAALEPRRLGLSRPADFRVDWSDAPEPPIGAPVESLPAPFDN